MKRTTRLIIVSGITAAVVAGGATTIAMAQADPTPPATTPSDLRDAGAAARTAVGDGDVVSVERDDDGGFDVEVRRADGTDVDVDLSPTLEVVRTTPDDADDRDDRDDVVPAGADLDGAATAALAAVGDGTVTDVEWDDGGYDVEIRRADRTEVDVRLDAAFAVVATEVDD